MAQSIPTHKLCKAKISSPTPAGHVCATSPALGPLRSRVPAPEPRSSRIQTSSFIPGPPSRSWWSEGCLQTPGGEQGEARARRGLSHAFTHSSQCAFVTPGPAKEVSIAPCATGLGPCPKGRPSSLYSSSFMLPLCQRLERAMPRDVLGCRCVGQGRWGLVLVGQCPAPHAPPRWSLHPCPAVTGTAEAMLHTHPWSS